MPKRNTLRCASALLALLLVLASAALSGPAEAAEKQMTGGGYAVTGQLEGVGCASMLYDAQNGLPTSDANCVFAASDGYIWIGGYSGVIRYDGSTFERLDASDGLANGRVIFEDSRGRIWVGTNDAGVVMLSGGERKQYTYRDGLTSSSVRSIAESGDGTIYIGLAIGACTVGDDGKLYPIDDGRLNDQSIIRLSTDADGRIYGNTKNGDLFYLEKGKVTAFFSGEELGVGKVTATFALPDRGGEVYLGTENGTICRAVFKSGKPQLRTVTDEPEKSVDWLGAACGRIWAISGGVAGYLDEKGGYHEPENIPFNYAIEMLTADYQGNLWLASSRQGVLKIVASNFQDLTELAGLPAEVVNTTCLYRGVLYIGTDTGLRMIGPDGAGAENELTEYIAQTRVRCLAADGEGNLWTATYTDGKGLVCYAPENGIVCYTEAEGLANNKVRCITLARDGSVLAGTNGGLSVIRNGEVVRTVGENDGIQNTVFLTVEEGENGEIYAGTDGDGIYVIGPNGSIRHLGRDDGLTSDVVMRVKRDDRHGVYWIITSNSIEYMRDGGIFEVSEFPYNNNYDVYYGEDDNLWILSSFGVYCAKAKDLLSGEPFEYKLYNTANGLACAPTGNSFSALDKNGDLYIAGRTGVSHVNINHYFEQTDKIVLGVRSVFCGDREIVADASGAYTLPADAGRIQIKAAVLDYSLTNPTIRVYLEGSDDPGVTLPQNRLSPLEFTGLAYGNYTLHIQVVNGLNGEIYQDETFPFVKEPRLLELLAVRILLMALLALVAGLIVWRVMTGTIIRRQYEQIRQAKDEAERANSAKSRFLANMSHEIRTPINTIMGMDEMILREDATDVPKGYFMSIANYAFDIKNASQSLLELINDLLDISKIESGKMHLVEQEYEPEAMLRSAVTMIRVRSAQKDLSFGVDVDGALPRRLYGDEGKIKQIVLNLLTNAVKYTDAGGFALTVSVEKKTAESCSLRFSVKDTGIGVKPEDMDKLFTAYERLDEEKNSGIQGTGLGLDISRQFAELMHGKLWCESVYGEGSEFILTLEQKIVDATEIGEFHESEDEAAKGPYVPQFVAPDAEVLVVDDNPMNLTVIKGLLKATKMFVSTAKSGEECLERLKYGTFNVVLLDHMMPGMDGIETVAEIRKMRPELPVYALTANAAAGGDEFYRSKGFNGYLAKPIDSVTLEKAIMRHLPEEIMMKPGAADAANEPTELPEDLLWLKETDGISVPDGIKCSGGVTAFIFSLNLFLDTIEGNAKVIEDAYANGDIRLYTVKVHALKSSARIIGAQELSALAEQLENAGNKEDMDFIRENTGKLMAAYRLYGEKLARLRKSQGADEDDRKPVPEAELKSAYAALREVVPQMDYDAVEMIVEQMKAYRLPTEDGERFEELEKRLKNLDWDGIGKLLG